MNAQNYYQAYLIRFQRSQEQPHWRITLVDVLSGEKQHFATERALFIHLMQSLAEEAPSMPESEDVADNRRLSEPYLITVVP